MIYILLAVIGLLFIVVIVMFMNNKKLKKEIEIVQKVIALKDTTIFNLEASRVSVKDVMDNFASIDEVVALVKFGESREDISKKLNISLKNVETIIKLDAIKKEKRS